MREKTWEEKAQVNPLYGVMSHDEFVDSGAKPTPEELAIFYARGREMVSKWIWPWLTESAVTEDMKILDFGCGMGRLTNALAESHDPTKVFGIDISETMISHAKVNTVEGIHYSIVGQQGDFPLEEEFFDRIYSYAVFQHISNRSVVEKSLQEIARTLKVGGYLKLNIEMAYPPAFCRKLTRDTYAFEKRYLSHGWKKMLGIPMWGLKIRTSNNWSGIRLGYGQLMNLFNKYNIEIDGIAREPGTARMIWFFGRKVGN